MFRYLNLVLCCYWGCLSGFFAVAQHPTSREYFLREVKIPNYDAKIEVNQWGDTVFVNYYKVQDPLNKTYNEFTKTFKGTPYFKNGWYAGVIYNQDGFPTNFQMAYNLQKHEVYVLNNVGREVVTLRPAEFQIAGHNFLQHENRYYETILAGVVPLLKEYNCQFNLYQSYQKTSYDSQSSPQGYEGEYLKSVKYFLKHREQLKEITAGRKWALSFGKHRKTLESYAKDQRLNPKKENDLVALVKYYNSLFP